MLKLTDLAMEKIDNIQVNQNKVEISTKSLKFAPMASVLSLYGELASLQHQEGKFIATYKNCHSTYRYKMAYELYRVMNKSAPTIVGKLVDNASMIPAKPLLNISDMVDKSNDSVEISTNKDSLTSLITLAINSGKVESIKRITTNVPDVLRYKFMFNEATSKTLFHQRILEHAVINKQQTTKEETTNKTPKRPSTNDDQYATKKTRHMPEQEKEC